MAVTLPTCYDDGTNPDKEKGEKEFDADAVGPFAPSAGKGKKVAQVFF